MSELNQYYQRGVSVDELFGGGTDNDLVDDACYVIADFGLAFYTLPTVGDPFLMNLWFLRSIARRQKNNMRFHVDTYSTPEFS